MIYEEVYSNSSTKHPQKNRKKQIALVITKKHPSNLGLPILIVLLLILFFQVLSVLQLV